MLIPPCEYFANLFLKDANLVFFASPDPEDSYTEEFPEPGRLKQSGDYRFPVRPTSL